MLLTERQISSRQIYLPLPVSCTTSLNFAKSWENNTILLVIFAATDTRVLPRDTEDDQYEIVLPAGTLHIADIYYNRSIDSLVVTCNFVPVSVSYMTEYIDSHTFAPGKVIYSNVGLCLDPNDPLVSAVKALPKASHIL